MYVLLLLLGLGPGGLSFPTENGEQFQRILGGSYARPLEYRFMLALEDLEEQFCGAVAISANWAISAAHCVYFEGAPKRMFLRAGSLVRGSGGTVHEVEAAYVPIDYDEGMNEYDISLLKVKRKFTVNRYVRFIQLPRQNEEVEDNTDAIVIGWGSTNVRSRSSRKLKKATLKTIEQERCAEMDMFQYHSYELTDDMLCAFKAGRDSRTGDSGGPLFIEEENRTVLIGIVSWGDGNGNPDWPGIYTKVSKYRNWIKKNTGV